MHGRPFIPVPVNFKNVADTGLVQELIKHFGVKLQSAYKVMQRAFITQLPYGGCGGERVKLYTHYKMAANKKN